jgi:thiamine-phosphate pyrophosphorylase
LDNREQFATIAGASSFTCAGYNAKTTKIERLILMSDQESTQIYLITPTDAELSFYTETLAPLLDKFPMACVRLGLVSDDESAISRQADQMREVAHARDVSAVITTHYRMVDQLGLDGVHRVDAAKSIRDIRDELGGDAIVGTHCGTSRHAGMNAGEASADYVCFGPMTQTALGDEAVAEFETFEWWSQMVELPVIAEGNLTLEAAEIIAPVADFIALGPELWNSEDPAKTLSDYIHRIT